MGDLHTLQGDLQRAAVEHDGVRRFRGQADLEAARQWRQPPRPLGQTEAQGAPRVVPFGENPHPFTALITKRVPVVLVDAAAPVGPRIDDERERAVDGLSGALLTGTQGETRTPSPV